MCAEVGRFFPDGSVLKKNDLEAGGVWGIGLFKNDRQAPIERHARVRSVGKAAILHSVLMALQLP